MPDAPAVRVAVLGASGFIGSAAVRALRAGGLHAEPVVAPRLQARPGAQDDRHSLELLADQLRGMDVVVNAAGAAAAASHDQGLLLAANALLPPLVLRAGQLAGVPRVVHLSSAAVQGRRSPLDEGQAYAAFSPYSSSKELGERAFLLDARTGSDVVLRPASVHGADRHITRWTAARARAGVLPVPVTAAGTATPQQLVENVAAAVVFLSTSSGPLPRIALQPSEGLTVAAFLELLGGRPPRRLPDPVARAVLAAAGRVPPYARGIAHARRIELLLAGQAQRESSLTRLGFTPPAGLDAWHDLGQRLARPRVSEGGPL